MDIKSAKQSLFDVAYNDNSFDALLSQLKNASQEQSNYYLCLFAGKPVKHKQKALQTISDTTGRAVMEADANKVISKSEPKTFKALDQLFKEYDPENTILYIKNASRFSGVYTGNTLSKIKYATPQERYFLNKLQQSGGLFIIDVDDISDADMTIRRAAQSIVTFEKPQSPLKRMFWNLKHITMQGSHLESERPERYDRTAGNF